MVLKTIRAILGGRIRLFVSGGAPMTQLIKDFITVVFSAPIIEALGQTESAGMLTATSIMDQDSGHQGGVCSCNKL